MPPEIPASVRIGLRRGSVFHGQHRDLTSPKPHFLVVLNTAPLKNEVIVLACASSKVEIRKKARGETFESTCVVVQPSQYKPFTCETVFDCNDVKKISLEELVQKIMSDDWECKPDFPSDLLALLVQATKASKVVKPSVKELI